MKYKISGKMKGDGHAIKIKIITWRYKICISQKLANDYLQLFTMSILIQKLLFWNEKMFLHMSDKGTIILEARGEISVFPFSSLLIGFIS